jgi:hypothetical protein
VAPFFILPLRHNAMTPWALPDFNLFTVVSQVWAGVEGRFPVPSMPPDGTFAMYPATRRFMSVTGALPGGWSELRSG